MGRTPKPWFYRQTVASVIEAYIRHARKRLALSTFEA